MDDDNESKNNELSLRNLYKLICYPTSSDGSIDKEKPYLLFKPHKVNNDNEFDEIKEQKYKVIFTLQNFIIYLIYRSNGTPKKLAGLTEQLIVKGPEYDKEERCEKNKEFIKENVVIFHETKDKNGNPIKPYETDLSKKLFLRFSFNTQYEIGLTSNLYRPFLIANSRNLKSMGDKLLFSSSFIIDHILKFHPFGFSWRNLELIPEVVIVTREPNLREFIENLMRFYSLNYIRDTVSGIFDYRFRSIVKRELIQLSKTSELSSAAFNFTLDESLSTKRHYKKKLIELREKYKDYSPTQGDNQFVHSLGFIQTILGDLHFYDKEYDEAIIFYTESIQTLRLPNAVTDRLITRHQFLIWLRNKLKLGLTLEKMRAYDSVFSLYKTLVLDTERYFKNIVSKQEVDQSRRNRIKNRDKNFFKFGEAEDHRTIQIVSMPFVALLAVTEKARDDGITYTNLLTNREDFLRTINAPKGDFDKDENINFDFYRKYFLMADYYNNVGSILYYKNCQFSQFFENKNYWLEAFSETKNNSFLSSLFRGSNEKILNQQDKLYDKQKDREYDFFPSLTSFNYYWNALYFLVKYHRERIVKEIERKNETNPDKDKKEKVLLKHNLLAICASYLLPECVDMVSSNRLYYIANVVSKIGDSILASLKKENFKIPKNEFDPLDITAPNEDADKKHQETIKKFRELVGDGESLFTAETVLYT